MLSVSLVYKSAGSEVVSRIFSKAISSDQRQEGHEGFVDGKFIKGR